MIWTAVASILPFHFVFSFYIGRARGFTIKMSIYVTINYVQKLKNIDGKSVEL
jgi:hypothetical protein